MRTRTILVAAAILAGAALAPMTGYAQEPAPDPAPFEVGILATYNLGSLEGADPLTGVALEADFRFAGSPVSLVAHASSIDPANFKGAGIRVGHDVGPFEVFGHYLFGQLTTGDEAIDGVSHRKGGGVNVPLGQHLFARMGADHDGMVSYSTVGVGARW